MARTRTSRGGAGRAGAPSTAAGSGAVAVLKFWNRTITIMRGTAADEFGDLSDVGTPYLTGVQAALAEVSDVVFDAATMRQQIIRAIKCTVPGWAGVLSTDTIQDEFTGFFYMIESIEAQPGIGYYPPFSILTLRMRSGVSVTSD